MSKKKVAGQEKNADWGFASGSKDENHFEGEDQKNTKTYLSWNYFENLPEELISGINVTKCSIARDASSSKVAERDSTSSLEMLDKLGILKYYPGLITLPNALSIRDDQYSKPTKLTDVPWIVLRNIFSVNFNFRENVLSEFFSSNTNRLNKPDENGDILSQLLSQEEKPTPFYGLPNETLHPLDLILLIFQCCDPFLKQAIVQKMSLCQLAVPLLYQKLETNELMLSIWPLREIVRSEHAESVVRQPMKTISFIRVGNGPVRSKSKLINELLRDLNEQHSTFFHRDCNLGMQNRKQSNGMVEISWYDPKKSTECRDSSKKNDNQNQNQLNVSMSVLNLRGDANCYQQQTTALLQMSNLIVLLITFEDLQDQKYFDILRKIHASKACLVILTKITDLQKAKPFMQSYSEEMKFDRSRTKILSLYDSNKGRELNLSEQNNKLFHNISDLLEKEDGIILEEALDRLPNSFISDEGEMCKEGRLCAGIISALIDITTKKNIFLPLQGETLWHEWSKIQKERTRTGVKAAYDSEENLNKSMASIRMNQVKALNEAPEIVARFVQILLRMSDCNEQIQYFLGWMRQAMDCKSRKVFPDLIKNFSMDFEIYEKDRTKESLETVDSRERELANASFGLEHFFREIGQIYEAFFYCKDEIKCGISDKTMKILLYLPALVAKLLVLGQPLELMDGDAANVPLKWTKAVFLELEKQISGKRFVTVSVLGVQSSGKSTLLNTLFGLQFAVRAGRCTKGIYGQIVPVDHSMSSIKFDYAMILDTEGLRAPELADKKVRHDNRLATLVIGLADIVIINIQGETLGDMENILQIVIHGLLRIKQVNKKIDLRQSCLFVHQNVSVENANTHMLQENKKIMQTLDAMTSEAALQEKIMNIVAFRDVIKFNPTSDVKYINDLWHGTPPLAPVSPMYSKSVTDVAKWILGNLTNNVHSMSLQDNYIRLDGLWKGILADDFVFSFRNSLEVKAYSMLESVNQRLIWELEEVKCDWVIDNIKPRLLTCTTTEDLDICTLNLEQHFLHEISQKVLEVSKQLKVFLQSSELSEYMIQWK